MKKSKVLVIATLITTMLSATTVFANQGKVINGRTMIPLRGAFTDLGFEVSWDGSTNTATLKDEDHVIKVKQNDVNFTVDGVTYKSDVAPTLINGSIYIPLRSIGDTIGAEVSYDQEMEMAYMSYGDDFTNIYVGTVPTVKKSSYSYEADTLDDIINVELRLIDDFNESMEYANVGDLDTAYRMLGEIIEDTDYLYPSDFYSLSSSIQANINSYAAATIAFAQYSMDAIDAVNNGDEAAFISASDYADKYRIMANLYHSALVDFYNDTFAN